MPCTVYMLKIWLLRECFSSHSSDEGRLSGETPLQATADPHRGELTLCMPTLRGWPSSVPVSPVASLTVCGLSLFSLPLSQMRKADIYAYGSPATYPLKPRRLVVYIVLHRHHFCQYFPTMYIVGCYWRELHNSYRHHAVLETHNQHACVVSLAICQTINKVHT